MLYYIKISSADGLDETEGNIKQKSILYRKHKTKIKTVSML